MVRDLDTPPPERLFLPGPAGRLAATYEAPAGELRGAVLHLHPHPLHGGTRQNNVVRHGALGSLQSGCAALRMDFRGVGKSAGHHDQGVGEVDDAQAALRWLSERHPGLPHFVWGFSFGSRVGLDLAKRAGRAVAGYLGVAWPTALYPLPDHERWPEHTAFLTGDHDDFVDVGQLTRLRARGASVTVVPGAQHFFQGMLDRVRGFTAATLDDWLPR